MMIKLKNYKNIFIIILISFIFVVPLLIFQSVNGDFITHISRIYNLSISFENYDFNPYMYQSCHYKYGYPFGIFYPDTFIKPFAFLSNIGVPIYISSILLLFVINIITMLIPYILLKKENIEKNKAFIISLIYFLYPYRFIDFIHRFSIGELYFFIFFPFVIYGFYKIFYKKEFSICLAIGFYGIAHSHMLSIILILIFCVFSFITLLTKTKFYKGIYFLIINAIITILTCLDIIIPICEAQYQEDLLYEINNAFLGTLYDNSYKIVNINNITTIIGFVLFISLIIFSVYDKNKIRKCFYLFGCLFLIQTNLFNWNIILKIFPQLNIIQFPFRFLVYGSLLWTYIIFNFKPYKFKLFLIKFILFIEIIITILLSYIYEPYNYNEMYFNVGAGDYINIDVDTTNLSFFDFNKNKENNIKTHLYFSENGYLPIFYYHNYIIKDEDNNSYTYENKNGLIYIEELEKENKTLIVTYQKTLLQNMSYILSICSIVIILLIYFLKNKFNKYKKES